MNKSKIEKIIYDNKFSLFEYIEKRITVADIFKPYNRCGIYVLKFCDDSYYVGKAIDVTRRYVQHIKNHEDIKEIAFRETQKEVLDETEQEIIKLFEFSGAELRNISLTSYPKGDSDLDLIIPKNEQELFLNNKNSTQELRYQIIDYPELRKKYSRKFNKLLNDKRFHEYVLPFLKEYLRKCVLQPEKTELSFWTITCLTRAFLNTQHIALCRINMFWCEVLTIWINNTEEIVYTFHLTKSLLPDSYLNSISEGVFSNLFKSKKSSKKLKSLTYNNHFYKRGGPDQFTVEVIGIDDALKLLHDEKVVNSIKTFNLRQMQKGATVYGKYHCLDFSKYLLNEN